MRKVLALYRTPDDVEAFMTHYNGVHVPLARKIPGLSKIEITSITRTLVGEEGNFLLAELYFEDDAFRSAMHSPENAALGTDLPLFADGLVTVMTGDLIED